MGNINIKRLAIYVPAGLIVVILALIPFHAFLTIWASSIFGGHYTAFRLWKEALLAVVLVGTLCIFFTDKKIRELFYYSRLIQLILIFFVIELLWGLVAHHNADVNTKALLYGWLSDCRYLLFFLVTLIIAKKTTLLRSKSIKLVMWPALVVIIFGLLQVLVLPRDFLAHFGYGPNTIKPYETINHNVHYIRIASTLRGSNPLGAYLLIPLSIATVFLAKGRRVWQLALFIIATIIVLIFSYSRSAWLGAVVAVAIAIYWGIKSPKLKKKLLYIGIAAVVILAGLFIIERNNPRVQNIVFHYQHHSSSPMSSDQGHSGALKTDLKQLVKKPLGTGPGTVGPASVYNNHPSYISENYYLQIGLETGWLGLIVFLAINLLVGISLWVRRKDALSLALLASFIGLIVCNLLLEAWTDDTLAYLWWGLAAIAIAAKPLAKNAKFRNWII